MASVRVLAALLLLATGGAAAPPAEDVLWVPVVAQRAGADGSYWNTEVWVSNLAREEASFAITFLPAGRDNSQLLLSQPEPTRLGPGETEYLIDVVPPSSSGALRVVTTPGVVVKCRLYNAQGQASVGQMVPALRPDELIQEGAEGYLLPLLRSSQLRTNVGFFNPGSATLTIRARLLDLQGEAAREARYTLEPGSQHQVNDILLGLGVDRSNGHELVLSGDGPFAAYASIVDTRTGAPSLVLPIVQ